MKGVSFLAYVVAIILLLVVFLCAVMFFSMVARRTAGQETGRIDHRTLAGPPLAFMLLAPWAIAQDPDPLAELRRRAEQGDVDALYSLGLRYDAGRAGVLGIPRDAPEAMRWFRLAAEQGHTDAQFSVGLGYAQGVGVLKDIELGHMWWNIASANGHEVAGEGRDMLEQDMTRAEISRATDLARTCMASDYQDCGR